MSEPAQKLENPCVFPSGYDIPGQVPFRTNSLTTLSSIQSSQATLILRPLAEVTTQNYQTPLYTVSYHYTTLPLSSYSVSSISEVVNHMF